MNNTLRTPLYQRLKWETDHQSRYWINKRGEVSLSLYHIRGTSWQVSAGALDAIITADGLPIAKRKAVSMVRAWVRNAARAWEVL